VSEIYIYRTSTTEFCTIINRISEHHKKFSDFEEFSQLLCTVTKFLYFRFLAVLQILVERKRAKFESSRIAQKLVFK